jgi:hypothetical protein
MNAMKERSARGDEIDGLLRSFFRAEMPEPWPAMEVEERPVVLKMTPPAPRTRSQVGRRIALAASVALLVAGSFFVLGRDSGYAPEAGVPRGSSTATNDDLMLPPEFELREQLEQLPDGRTRVRFELIPRRGDR